MVSFHWMTSIALQLAIWDVLHLCLSRHWWFRLSSWESTNHRAGRNRRFCSILLSKIPELPSESQHVLCHNRIVCQTQAESLDMDACCARMVVLRGDSTSIHSTWPESLAEVAQLFWYIWHNTVLCNRPDRKDRWNNYNLSRILQLCGCPPIHSRLCIFWLLWWEGPSHNHFEQFPHLPTSEADGRSHHNDLLLA